MDLAIPQANLEFRFDSPFLRRWLVSLIGVLTRNPECEPSESFPPDFQASYQISTLQLAQALLHLILRNLEPRHPSKNLALFFVCGIPVLSLTLFPTISNEPTTSTLAYRPDFLLGLVAISAARELWHVSEVPDHIEYTLRSIRMELSNIRIRVSLYRVVARDGVRGGSFLE